MANVRKKEKSNQKRKKEKESISKKISSSSKMSKEELLDFLKQVIKGEVKEFTGLPPSIETRMKAMDRYLSLTEETEATQPVEAIKIVVDDRSDEERLERLEKEILESAKRDDN